MKIRDLIKKRVEFSNAVIEVGQLRIISKDGKPENTVVILDGEPRVDIGRIEIEIDASRGLAAINLFLLPFPPKVRL